MTNIPFSDNLDILRRPLEFGEKTAANRIVIQPMEGCDGTADGGFTDLTHRRYQRFAAGGAGLVWFEATAVTREGRANPRQLMLTEKTLDEFKKETEQIREISMKQRGYSPLLVLQLTHSGRYSKPEGKPAPRIACNKPLFEKDGPIDAARIMSDDELESLGEQYGICAGLAQKAGFDGADIKACHGYLMNELLGAYERPGKYGGCFENRTRLFFDAFEAARSNTQKGFLLTSRMNVYDGFPYPFGFGVSEESGQEPDLRQAHRIIDVLRSRFGVELMNVTIGNPYVNPHVNRPFRKGPYEPPEDPLEGVSRILGCANEVQREHPEIAVIASGFSYLGKDAARAAAGAVREEYCRMTGFGRMSFAYPDFPGDILTQGRLDPKRCCIACGKCSQLMRAGTVAGCVIRDSEIYLPIYRKFYGMAEI